MADAHAKPHHDYHLVDPSPWPAVGSVSAFVLAVGAITWMHHMFAAAPLVFGAGVIGVLYTMLSWWRDVIKEAQYEGFHTRVVQISHRYGMILFIASEVMFFVAWFWAYFNTALFPADVHQVLRGDLIGHVWPPVPSEHFTRHVRSLAPAAAEYADPADFGHHGDLGAPLAAARRSQGPDQRPVADHPARATFTCVQAYEYAHAAFTYSGHIYGATFFMATGFHGAHVHDRHDIPDRLPDPLLRRPFHARPSISASSSAAWYWHFVDVVWLFLFACIYVWGGGVPLAHH